MEEIVEGTTGTLHILAICDKKFEHNSSIRAVALHSGNHAFCLFIFLFVLIFAHKSLIRLSKHTCFQTQCLKMNDFKYRMIYNSCFLINSFVFSLLVPYWLN